MNTFLKIKKAIDEGLTFFLGFVMFAMAAIVFVQVIARYFFGQAFSWPEEIVRAGVVWTTFMGSYVALVKKKEIRFDVVVGKFSDRTRLILGIIGEILTLIFLIVVVKEGWLFVTKFAAYKLPMTGLSRAVVYIVFPLGGFLMLVHSVLALIGHLNKAVNVSKDIQQDGGVFN